MFSSVFYLGVKGQGQTNVMCVRDTSSYGHAPTYQISLTYLERQNSYGPDKLHQLFNLYLTFYGETASEAAGKKIRLKQYISLHSRG